MCAPPFLYTPPQGALDDERVTRLEREAQTLKRVGEDVLRMQARAAPSPPDIPRPSPSSLARRIGLLCSQPHPPSAAAAEQEKVEAERAVRDSTIARLQNEVADLTAGRSVADERFQAAVLQEMSLLKNALEVERAERVSEDETIVAAVNDYTRALQDGLRIVANT